MKQQPTVQLQYSMYGILMIYMDLLIDILVFCTQDKIANNKKSSVVNYNNNVVLLLLTNKLKIKILRCAT